MTPARFTSSTRPLAVMDPSILEGVGEFTRFSTRLAADGWMNCTPVPAGTLNRE